VPPQPQPTNGSYGQQNEDRILWLWPNPTPLFFEADLKDLL
jgi:hypothetical protein